MIDPIWTVWCDLGDPGDPTCHHWCQDTAATRGDAWAQARVRGWRRIGGRHACPGCRQKARSAPPLAEEGAPTARDP